MAVMDARGALAVAAVWAMAVPWIARALGQTLDVTTRLEVIDHVVPGAAVLVCCALAGAAGEFVRLSAAGVALLAGLWITATHVTLVSEAADGITPWGAALLHLSAGPPVLLLSLWMLLRDGG